MTQAWETEAIRIVNKLIMEARPVPVADTYQQTSVTLALTPMSDTKIYVSVLVKTENIFGIITETAHKKITITKPKKGDFTSLVRQLRAEMNPTSQYTFGSSVKMEINLK